MGRIGAGGHLAPPSRTSGRSMLRLRCTQRKSASGPMVDTPVKLVVFDLDETLTLVTFMTHDGRYQTNETDMAIKINFQTPWVDGDRRLKLKRMLSEIALGKDGQRRTLAILTKNGNASGVRGVLNLLKLADLAEHFSAIWIMPWRKGTSNGAYKDEHGCWKLFDPPLEKAARNHKADVLKLVAKDTSLWFPQLDQCALEFSHLQKLTLENIVLVDDERSNFHSDSGAFLLRYCKVARYDADYYSLGFTKNMGGIGAHDDADYETLKRFVEDPWMCTETLEILCLERCFDGSEARNPVSLVVLDFDETLTLATFMPNDEDCSEKIGWTPSNSTRQEWSEADLVKYNFESPFVAGSRVAKLQALCRDLAQRESGGSRTLAILTKNQHGVIAVLNLLMMAGLAEYFAAIWTVPQKQPLTQHRRAGPLPSGAYQTETGQWVCFEAPLDDVHTHHKADVIQHVVANPSSWFPQLSQPAPKRDFAPEGEMSPGGFRTVKRGLDDSSIKELLSLQLEGVVLVDDERANFRSCSSSEAKVLRYCKVQRYDEEYRDCGKLTQMGGIGAHSDADYPRLKDFVENPWNYPYKSTRVDDNYTVKRDEISRFSRLGFTREEADVQLDEAKTPRLRTRTEQSTLQTFMNRFKGA